MSFIFLPGGGECPEVSILMPPLATTTGATRGILGERMRFKTTCMFNNYIIISYVCPAWNVYIWKDKSIRYSSLVLASAATKPSEIALYICGNCII